MPTKKPSKPKETVVKQTMRILYIVPYVPNLIRVRPYNLIRHLAARGHEVTVLTLWITEQERADAQALKEHCHRVLALPLSRWRSLWNCLRALPTRVPLQAVYCWHPNLISQLSTLQSPSSILQPQPFDVVHVEHLRGARYGLHLQSPISNLKSQIPIVWDSVDCISYLFEQAARDSRSAFGRLVTRLELGRTRRYEGWLAGQFDSVLVTSETDRQALETLHASRFTQHASRFTSHTPPIKVLPNGVDLAYFTPTDEPREPDTLVFSGKMSYHANVTAALYLVHDIMPLVWAQRPDVKVWIVGKDPPREITNLKTSHQPIAVTGTVPDIRPYLRRATAAVVPTPYGAGIQNKVLEAMACDTPVVASPQAVSALQVVQRRDLLVSHEPREFARDIFRLLEDRELASRLGAAGRHYVEENHNWDVVTGKLEETYQEIATT
jgi:sugar transferase (PEP-CTERM/EpsH1 system associated)